LKAQLGGFGELHVLNAEDSARLWRSVRDAEFVAEPRERAIWRISLAPSRSAEFLGRIGAGATAMLDAGGGLLWLATDPTEAASAAVRAAMAGLAGHATLARAPEALRARVDVFEPLSAPLMQLTKSLKASLDPQGLFNAGRMYAGV
jgi:glycolate oxidase FAD binding subunit